MQDPRQKREAALAGRVAELRRELLNADPATIASRTGTVFQEAREGGGGFHFDLWNRSVVLTFPHMHLEDAADGTGLTVFDQAMVLHYFAACDGAPESGTWIAFSDLPDGRFYSQAFQSYTGAAIARSFGNDLDAFEAAARDAGGDKRFPTPDAPLGDAAFAFRALPRVPLLVAYWLGDDDFPPNCRVLFDSAVAHHLPTEACAILGSTLTGRLVATIAG